MYGLIYQHFVDMAKKEGFAGGTSEAGAIVVAFLAILVVVVIQLFVVQWLWNNVLTRVVSIARPIPSMPYTLGLLILIAMIHPGYVSASASA
jgi:hypothetical protein